MKFSMKKLMENKYLLWAVFGLTIVNVLGYLANNQYNSLTFMICVGLLTSFFNKNMIVVLLVAILSTALVNSRKIIEGMVPDKKDGEAGEAQENPEMATKNGPEMATKNGPEMATKNGPEMEEEEEEEIADVKDTTNPAIQAVLTARDREEDSYKNNQCYKKDSNGKWKAVEDKIDGKCEPKAVDWNTCGGIDECKSLLKSGFSNMKSKNVVARASTEARVDGKDDLVNRIDSKATMSQTMNNLNNIVGKGGIKGLTKETKELLEQQKELVQSLGQMAPILKSAKSTLNGLDLPDISGLSNLLKGMNGN